MANVHNIPDSGQRRPTFEPVDRFSVDTVLVSRNPRLSRLLEPAPLADIARDGAR